MQRNLKNRTVFILIILIFLSTPAFAINVKDVQKNYAAHKDFTVDFTQKTFQALLNREVNFTGKVFYKKPASVRMDVTTPQKQIIILKGSTAFISIPEEGTQAVQEIPKEISSSNILAFIAGLSDIEKDYNIKDMGKNLELTPKTGTGTINVWVNKNNLVYKIQFQDAMGNKSEINLSGFKFDSNLKDDLFKIAPQAAKTK